MAKKILIIEDEKMLAEMYRERFLREGFECLSASTTKEGLELARKEASDLVLLDILLPDGNGTSFLREKQKDPKISSIPVIAFSNFDDPETKEQALALGASEYLLKTDYTPQELIEKVCLYVK